MLKLSIMIHGVYLLDSHLHVTFEEVSWLSWPRQGNASCKMSYTDCHAALHLGIVDVCNIPPSS